LLLLCQAASSVKAGTLSRLERNSESFFTVGTEPIDAEILFIHEEDGRPFVFAHARWTEPIPGFRINNRFSFTINLVILEWIR
jgi:hypothetical protein